MTLATHRPAGEVAELTGLHVSFVGTWLVGFSTSLPELVTSIAATVATR